MANGGGVPEISLNAQTSISIPQTMRVKRGAWGGWVVMLLDRGSTHNFMSTSTARRLGLHMKMSECFEVALANGGRICSEGCCNGVQVCLNGAEFVIDFFLIANGEL